MDEVEIIRCADADAPQRSAAVPEDLVAALAGSDRARVAFEALSRSDRYGIFLPLLKARTPAGGPARCGGRWRPWRPPRCRRSDATSGRRSDPRSSGAAE
ncbi:YdeI/OmpD-associated family protein [Micromonospora sp. NPDC002717]|uniref:YdeI/OmpD-associated family protein n=1 Tax=Micromonospora sp. NPDC002717 TaxID=3154424 RepID=UPI003318DD25